MSSEEARTTTGASLDRAKQEALLKDLQKQVALLEEDLRERAGLEEFDLPLQVEYAHALESERTAAPYETWLDERLVQIAAAWVLACVFVRFSEDNGLIPDAWLSGPRERLAEAQDRHDDHFRAHPDQNDRDWLKESFQALADAHTTAAGLFDKEHNPMWEVTPSYEAATRLLAFGVNAARTARSATTSLTPSSTRTSSAICTRTCPSTPARRTRCCRPRSSSRSSSST